MEVVLQSENHQQQQKQQHQEVVLMNHMQLQQQQIKQGDHKETTGSSCKKKHLHVLAVDDSQTDRKILEQLLTVSSYQVTCVDSGDKALQLLGLGDDDTPPDLSSSSSAAAVSSTLPQQIGMQVNLIMTDYSMPGITGYDLLKRIKGSSSWKDVPVVVMSSENVPSRIHMCLKEGAEEFLLKPVRRSDLEKLQPRINTNYKSSPCLQHHGYGNSQSSSNFDESKQEICCCCYINKEEIMSSLIDHDNYCCKFNMRSQSSSSSSIEEETSAVAPPITITTTTAAGAGASDDQVISSSVMLFNPPATEALS